MILRDLSDAYHQVCSCYWLLWSTHKFIFLCIGYVLIIFWNHDLSHLLFLLYYGRPFLFFDL